MAELAYVDPAQGNVVIAFDGTVVELFVEGKASISRVHVRMLYIEVKGPYRKGHYEVDFSSAPNGLGGFRTWVSGETWPWFTQFLDGVRAVTGR